MSSNSGQRPLMRPWRVQYQVGGSGREQETSQVLVRAVSSTTITLDILGTGKPLYFVMGRGDALALAELLRRAALTAHPADLALMQSAMDWLVGQLVAAEADGDERVGMDLERARRIRESLQEIAAVTGD